MPFSYKSRRGELANLSALTRNTVVRQQAAQRATPEQAWAVADLRKKYPWMDKWVAQAVSSQAKDNDNWDDLTEFLAKEDAKQRGRGKRTFWSKVGDVASSAGKAVSTVSGGIDRAVNGTPGLGQLNAQVKDAARVGFTALQAGGEVLSGGLRVTMRNWDNAPSAPGQVLAGATANPYQSVENQARIGVQTVAGQAAGALVRGEEVDLGDGFFPQGKTVDKAVEAQRATASINGSAVTLGRLGASVIFEPGTLPYNVASGAIDAVAAWKLDPAAAVLNSAGDARKASKAFQGADDAGVARAAERASSGWRETVEESIGMVTGRRNTVAPAAVDRWLFSETAKKYTARLAEETSPTAIWRAHDKKIPATLANQLASATDDTGVLGALRPALGVTLEKPKTGAFTNSVGSLGMRVTHSLQNHFRAFNVTPETWLDFSDPDTLLRNLDNSLANAKVPIARRNQILDDAFAAFDGEAGDQFRLINTAKAAVRESLEGYGVPDEIAGDLTKWYSDDRSRRFLMDPDGVDVNLPFITHPDGTPITSPSPASLHELLNHGVPLYDPKAVRAIRRQTSRLGPLLDAKVVKAPVSLIDFLTQELFKPMAVVRPAYFMRVNTEETARVLASGRMESAFDYLMYATSRRGATDAGGHLFSVNREADDLIRRLDDLDGDELAAAKSRLNEINDILADDADDYTQALIGRTWKHDGGASLARMEQRHATNNWEAVSKTVQPRKWVDGMGEQYIQASTDPILRRVANGGLFDGDTADGAREGLDGIKDWLRAGTGTKFKKKLEAWRPDVDWDNEAILDQFLQVQADRVKWLTGEHADLRNAIATGTFNGKALGVKVAKGKQPTSAALRERLEGWMADPLSPNMTKYEQTFDSLAKEGNRAAGDFLAARDAAVNYFFGNLYGRASDYLARSPHFKAAYWDRAEQLLPWADEATRAKILANAADAGLSKKKLDAMRNSAAQAGPDAQLAFDDLDGLAKGYGLDETKKLLYDSSERSQFFDISRSIFPFGEAWKEVIGRWMNLVKDNPQIPRRFQQIVVGARGSGFFHEDPATGQEVFSYPLPGPVADFFGVGDVEFLGSVEGLSLATSVLPGLGPVAQVAAAELLPDDANTDWISEILFPYGEPDTGSTGSALRSVLPIPGWADKIWQGFKGDPNGDRIFANTYMEVVRQKVASGEYENTAADKERLLDDARSTAQAITVVRGIGQAILPSSPRVAYEVVTKGGDVIAAVLSEKYNELREQEAAGEIEDAEGAFVERYGDAIGAYMVGKSKNNVGGLGASSEFGAWERDNASLFQRYPDVAGYFGPDVEGFDMTVVSRQEREGKREPRTAEELISDGQSAIAGFYWRRAKEQVPDPDDAQQAWLDQVKADLLEDFPEWNPDAFPAGKREGAIRQLQAAAKDEKIADTEAGEALAIYFAKRDEAIAEAKKLGSRTGNFGTIKKAAPLRAWMRAIGNDLSEDFPQFRRVWEDVLEGEMKEDEDDGVS